MRLISVLEQAIIALRFVMACAYLLAVIVISVMILLGSCAPADADTLTFYDSADYGLYSLDVDTGGSTRLGDSEPYDSLTRTPAGLFGVPHGDVATMGGSVFFSEWTGIGGRPLFCDGEPVGSLPFGDGALAMAARDGELYVLYRHLFRGDEPVSLFKSARIPWDLTGDSVVDDADLNVLLSGAFTPADLDGLLADFGRRMELTYVLNVSPTYVLPDWFPEYPWWPLDAAFVDGRLFVTGYSGYVLEVDLATGDVEHIGGSGHLAEGLAAGGQTMFVPIGTPELIWDLDNDGDVDDVDLNIVLSSSLTPEEMAEPYLWVCHDFGRTLDDETQTIPEPTSLNLLGIALSILALLLLLTFNPMRRRR